MVLRYPSNFYENTDLADLEEYDRSLQVSGYIHESDLPNLDYIAQCLTDIMKAVYETGDISSIEFALEDALSEFGIKTPTTLPMIDSKIQENKSSIAENIRDQFVSLTRNYAKEI